MTPRPKFAMTYLVYWPEAKVLKVGRTSKFNRLQMMGLSGGRVLVLARGTDKSWEREALRSLRRWFPTAFGDAEEATALLYQGSGWSECFAVEEHYLQLA